jgi:hypothetical protein
MHARNRDHCGLLHLLSMALPDLSSKSMMNSDTTGTGKADLQTSRFEKLVQEASEASCLFTTDEYLVKTHDDRNCTKCYLDRKVRRFGMDAHEHPLPADPIHAKTVVFELSCPDAFAAYRDCTWQIISTLAFPTAEVSAFEPQVLLGDYSELKPYIHSR